MRTIKFRAWCKDTKEMFNVDVLAISACSWDCPDFGKRGVSLTHQPSRPVMQFTGLKDKNGVEIYEGDIVECYGEVNGTEHKELQIVRYWCGNPCLCFPNAESGIPIYPFNVTHKLYVIGNIYQSPELVETQRQDNEADVKDRL